MDAFAVVLEQPKATRAANAPARPGRGRSISSSTIEWSAISTGTERLLYEGRMPPFPGMGYPLVPGYEAVGRVRVRRCWFRLPQRRARVRARRGRCFGEVRSLFGAAASRLGGSGAARRRASTTQLGERGVLLALAATAYHALAIGGDGRAGLHRRSWRARASAGAPDDRARRRAAGGVGDAMPSASVARCGYSVIDPGG